MLKKLAEENAEMKKSAAELRLRKEELRVCNANLAKIRKDKGNVENWATKVDDEKELKNKKLQETRGKLDTERVKSGELTQRVDAMQVTQTHMHTNTCKHTHTHTHTYMHTLTHARTHTQSISLSKVCTETARARQQTIVCARMCVFACTCSPEYCSSSIISF